LKLWEEIKRRRVWQVALIYLAGAFALAQVAQLLLESYVAPAWVIQLIIALLAAGFPFSLVLAWFFDLTPHGLERTEDEAAETQSGPKQVSKPSDALSLPPEDDKSIAVLPFVNMSDDDSNEYFADGISEELLNLLAKISDLRVISRSSAFAFKGKNLDMKDVANRLHVANLLEGSVRKSGNKVRVTAQLIRAHSDAHLWSETWDRDLDDIFKVQDEIAEAVVKELKIKLLGEMPTLQETDADTYALYLQAYNLSIQSGSTSASMVLCEEVLRRDPSYVPAWICLARNRSNMANFGGVSMGEAYGGAIEALEQALKIDPNSPNALSLSAVVDMTISLGDASKGASLLTRAFKLAPQDSYVLRNVGDFYQHLGDAENASKAFAMARVSDPVNPTLCAIASIQAFFVGRYEETIELNRLALSLAPSYRGAHASIARALLAENKLEEALETALLELDDGWKRIMLALIYHALGDMEQADTTLAKIIELDEEVAAFDIGYIYAMRGETDKAFEWLDKAIEYKDGGLSYVLLHPYLQSLHDDPRWMVLLERLGRTPEQIAALNFHLDLPEPEGLAMPQRGAV